MRTRHPYYRPGDHLVVSDRSGRTFWRSECIKEWNGSLVHRSEYEPRHPQDLVRARSDKISVEDARPLGQDQFLSISQVTRNNLTTPPTFSAVVDPTETIPSLEELDNEGAPSDNFDLSQFYLTIPDSSYVLPEVLSAGYTLEDAFYTDPVSGGMIFKCPNIAGTSENSNFSRVELRELLNPSLFSSFKHDMNNWVSSASSDAKQNAAGGVDGTLWGRLTIDHVSTTGDTNKRGRVIIGQIHGQDTDTLCRLLYHKRPEDSKGALYFGVTFPGQQDYPKYFDVIGGRENLNPSNGIALGERFVYRIRLIGTVLTVTIYPPSGSSVTTTITMPAFFENRNLYFKAGCYNQNNTGTDYCQVTFYTLTHPHPY